MRWAAHGNMHDRFGVPVNRIRVYAVEITAEIILAEPPTDGGSVARQGQTDSDDSRTRAPSNR